MNNEIQRKITSLTLMAVMVAGGLTFAFPGMEPAFAANPHLYVSAEEVGNFAGIQVLEIIVNDPNRASTSESEGRPSVNVNGDDVLMTQADDGAWYAYVANSRAIDAYGSDIIKIYGTTETDTDKTISSGSEADTVFAHADEFLEGFKKLIGADIRFAADRITIGSTSYTADRDFDVTGTDTQDAINLVSAINTNHKSVVATLVGNTGNTVTLTAINSGDASNGIIVSTTNSTSINVGNAELLGGADNVNATATIIVNNPSEKQKAIVTIEFESPVNAGTTINVNGTTITAVLGAPSTGLEFDMDSTNSQDAIAFANVVRLINSNVDVTTDGAVITIIATNVDALLNVSTANGNNEILITEENNTPDTITIQGDEYIAGKDFAVDGTNIVDAEKLAESINKKSTSVKATTKSNIITLVAQSLGSGGNSFTISTSAIDRLEITAFEDGDDEAFATSVITLTDVNGVTSQTSQNSNLNQIDNNPTIDSTHWPFIQTYIIASDSDVTITYGNGGTAQKVKLFYEYDDRKDIKLDREDYPKRAYVQLELDDSLLNLSPTADDLWAFNIDTEQVIYFIEDTSIQHTVDWDDIGFEEGPLTVSNSDKVLKFEDTRISNTISEIDAGNYIILRQSDRDDNIFVNYDRRDKSGLIVDNIGEASLSYLNGHSVINDAFIGDISFESISDWGSGTELEIILVDEDRNLDSRIDETMSILEDEVPFIRIGNPLHLNDVIVDDDLITVASEGSKTFQMTTDSNTVSIEIPVPYLRATEDGTVFNYISYDFSEVGGFSRIQPLTTIESGTYKLDLDVNVNDSGVVYLDVLSFGQNGDLLTGDDGTLNDNVSRVNDAFYRLELEEDAKDSATFVGTVEYIMINQLNVLDDRTYDEIVTDGDTIIMIVNDDMDGSDAITVTYYDEDSTGQTIISTQRDANTHTGVIQLDNSGYSSGGTINITLIDADLNTDSNTKQVYSVNRDNQWIGDKDTWLVKLLIDDEVFDDSKCNTDEYNLFNTGLTLTETSRSSDTFEGSLELPAKYCTLDTDDVWKNLETNGLDIDIEYQDYSDQSGRSNESSAGASIRSNTGSVTLDRTVYPVPFAAGEFALYDEEGFLRAGDVVLTIAVTDADANTASSGTNRISTDVLKLEVHRGASLLEIVIDDLWLIETSPTSGVFEVEVVIPQDDYHNVSGDNNWDFKDGRINQGDILTVEYTDPQDAGGDPNTVTDSATFDLRNAVLQTDKSVYIIGSSAIITLIEPDLDLDSESTETWSLDLINWDSDAGDPNLSDSIFDANPSGLRETGDNTGIFQVVIEIPREIGADNLERGEQITLEYQDNGPAGADYVGDDTEDITVDLFTSNFGATISLDQKVYTWTDKVYITIVAPDHNFDNNVIDEIGVDRDSEINISTRSEELENYKLVETGPDTGIFTGEVILTGFASHDADGDGKDSDASGQLSARFSGPTNGLLPSSDDDGLSVSFEFSDGETVVGSSLIRWNIGEIQWLEASYPASGSGVIRVIDPDMNLNPESVDSFDLSVWSDTVSGGINLRVTETNEATGIFEGIVFFTTTSTTSGSRLLVSEGDTVTAEYEDNTLPDPYSRTTELRVTSTTVIGTLVPPLERAVAGNHKVVDAFGNNINPIQVDQQVQVQADIVNRQDRAQKFAYLVQIQDNSGVTISLSWITGNLTPGQSMTSAVSWIPLATGSYTATTFVWESVDNPTALSPPGTIEITVR